MSRTDDLRAALLLFAQKVERRTLARVGESMGKRFTLTSDSTLEQTNIELAVDEICQLLTEDAA